MEIQGLDASPRAHWNGLNHTASSVGRAALAAHHVTRPVIRRNTPELLVAKGRARSHELREDVFRGLVEIAVDQMGISPAEVRPESRWVPDICKWG
jgi:hypothetical protein